MPESPADPQPGPTGPLPWRLPAQAQGPLLWAAAMLLLALAAGVAFTGAVWPSLPALAAAPLAALSPLGRAPGPRRVAALIGCLMAAAVGVAALIGSVDEPWAWATWLLTLAALAEISAGAQQRGAHLQAHIRAEQQARAALAVRDPLTDVANRSGLDMVATPMIENARRKGDAVHALYLDLDHFHVVNDTLGASVGDDLLAAFALALVGSTRSTDIVGRWAGDEFVVIGPGVGTSPLEMERRLKSRLEQEPKVPAAVWQPRVSIGSATLVPWDDGDLESLLNRAEQDMQLRRSLRRQQALPRRTSEEPPAGGPGWTPTGWDALRGGAPRERRRSDRDVPPSSDVPPER